MAGGAMPLFGALPITFPGGPMNVPQQFECDADRVVQAGGALATKLLHPDAKPFQRTYRRFATNGIYSGTRQKPYQFVLGAFTVPPQMVLALQAAIFQPYRFDPLAPGDAIPLEDRRLSLSIGYDLTFSTAGRAGNIETEIIPGNPDISPAYPTPAPSTVAFPALPFTDSDNRVIIPSVEGPPTFGTAFDGTLVGTESSTPQQFVLSTAAGGALMAQTQASKQGPEDMPFTYLVNEGENVTLWVMAFGPVRIPLAFFEGTVAGYLLPKTTTDALLKKMRPCG